jgi:hypothetical protein
MYISLSLAVGSTIVTTQSAGTGITSSAVNGIQGYIET